MTAFVITLIVVAAIANVIAAACWVSIYWRLRNVDLKQAELYMRNLWTKKRTIRRPWGV